jgi:hypothetical protein
MLMYSRTYYGDGDPNPNPNPNPNPDSNPTKTFTQEQVDNIIRDRLKKQRTEQEKLLSQLEELKTNKNLSDSEKEDLQKQINDLQSISMTKEELAAKEKKELANKYTKELETSKKDIEIWKDRYTKSTIERALIDAAVENKAVRPQQIVDLLVGRTRLVENAGVFVPQIKFEGKDKDGKAITLDLPVKEAMVEIKNMVDEYGNLFISDASGGIGLNQNSGGSKGFGDLKDTAAYIQARRKGLTLDQIKVG